MCERSFLYMRLKTRVQPLCICVSLSKNLMAFRRCSGEKKPNHFLRRHVRRRKYRSACKRVRRSQAANPSVKKETFLTATNAGADCSAPARGYAVLRQPKIRSSCRRPMHAR